MATPHSKQCPECSYEMSLGAIEQAMFTHCPKCKTVTLDNFVSAKAADAPRCSVCGYTKEDAATHMDHYLCSGQIPLDSE